MKIYFTKQNTTITY